MADEIKSPEEMTDEELNAFLGEQEEEKPEEKPEKPEDSEAEEKEEEEQEEEKPDDAEEEDSEDEEEEKEEEKPISRRKQARLDKLAKIFETIQSGEDAEEEPQKPKKPEGIKYDEELEADDETIKRLDDDREKFGQEMYLQGLAQANAIKQQQEAFEFKQMLTREEDRVREKYPFMNPDDEEHFKPEITESLVKDYLHFTQFDPQTKTAKTPVNYFDYIEARVQQAEALAEEMVSETKKNVVKQAANTGLRPSGSAPSKSFDLTKAPEDMSDEELDAVLDTMYPAQKRR